jgi:hypothetical protein
LSIGPTFFADPATAFSGSPLFPNIPNPSCFFLSTGVAGTLNSCCCDLEITGKFFLNTVDLASIEQISASDLP